MSLAERRGIPCAAQGSAVKGGILSRERIPPFDPPRERQGRFDLAPAPLTTKREGPCPSFLDYPPHGTSGKHCAYLGWFRFDSACQGGIAALAAVFTLFWDTAHWNLSIQLNNPHWSCRK